MGKGVDGRDLVHRRANIKSQMLTPQPLVKMVKYLTNVFSLLKMLANIQTLETVVLRRVTKPPQTTILSV